jgi:hypothetical protein
VGLILKEIGSMKKMFAILFVFVSVDCFAVEWVSTRDEAVSRALAEGKKILLLAGRDTCGNCNYVRLTVAETPDISRILNEDYVCWYCIVDTTTDWHPYAQGLGSFTLPLICVIDPADPLVYLDRSTSVVYAADFKPRLLSFVNYKPLEFDMVGLAYLAQCWQTVSGDEHYSTNYDFNKDNKIDTDDLVLFCNNWLWANSISDGFESGDLIELNWSAAGNAGWSVQSGQVGEGSLAAKSGAISHNQNSGLVLTLNTECTQMISFDLKVSSEPDYDFLSFYVDGNLVEYFTGQIDWDNHMYFLDSTNHVFKWEYSKDATVSSGEDCAYIDNVRIHRCD